jgi:hypothetical protein
LLHVCDFDTIVSGTHFAKGRLGRDFRSGRRFLSALARNELYLSLEPEFI